MKTHEFTRGYIIDGFPVDIKSAKYFEQDVCKVSKVIYVTLELDDFLAKIKRETASADLNAARDKFLEQTKKLDVVYKKYEGDAIKIYLDSSPEEICRQLVEDLKEFYEYKF